MSRSVAKNFIKKKPLLKWLNENIIAKQVKVGI